MTPDELAARPQITHEDVVAVAQQFLIDLADNREVAEKALAILYGMVSSKTGGSVFSVRPEDGVDAEIEFLENHKLITTLGPLCLPNELGHALVQTIHNFEKMQEQNAWEAKAQGAWPE